MPAWKTIPLRAALACLFLGEAWLHLFYQDKTPYQSAIQNIPQLDPVNPPLVCIVLGVWFFISGLVVMIWRPRWLANSLILTAGAPMALVAFCWAIGYGFPTLIGNAILILCPLILALAAGDATRGMARFFVRLGLTLSFGLFSLVALSLPGLPALTPPQEWRDAIEAITRHGSAISPELVLRLLGGVGLAASVMLWIRPVTVVASVMMSVLAIGGMIVLFWSHFAAPEGWLATLHRWGPEILLRAPFVLLPVVLLQLSPTPEPDPQWSGAPPKPPRRKLKRVDAVLGA